MTEAKHTPGPWLYAFDKADPKRYPAELWANSEPNPHILTFNKEHPNLEANANLIAAAPELLEALEIAVKEINAWRSGRNSRVALDDAGKAKVGSCYGGLLYATAALHKATGETAA